MQTQQQRVVRVGNGSAVITGGSNTNTCGNVVTGSGSSSSSVAGQQNNGVINTQVGIQSQPGLVQPVSAALLADRYLLLDLVDGSSLYRCIDVRSHDELVCKVNILLFCLLLINAVSHFVIKLSRALTSFEFLFNSIENFQH